MLRGNNRSASSDDATLPEAAQLVASAAAYNGVAAARNAVAALALVASMQAAQNAGGTMVQADVRATHEVTLGLAGTAKAHCSAVRESDLAAAATGGTTSRVVLEPRRHRYESVVFASTSVSVSLALENVKLARCRDRLLPLPERRYSNLRKMKPSALISRCVTILLVVCKRRYWLA